MRKRFEFVLFAAFFIFAAVFAACKNAPIFAAIEQEVKLKKSSVQGIILGLVQVKDEVFTANFKTVFKKSLGEKGAWKSIGSPSSSCSSLATDGKFLLAAFSDGAYYYDGEWKRVTGGESIGKLVSGNTIMGVDRSSNLFKIQIVSAGDQIVSASAEAKTAGGKNIKISGNLIEGAGNYFVTEKAVYNSSTGMKVSGSPDSNIRSICAGEGNDVFILTISDLLHYDGINFKSARHEVYQPWSISYLSSKKLVLTAGSKGYKEVKTDSAGKLTNPAIIYPGSAESTTPPWCVNQYNNSVGLWLLRPILAVEHNGGYIIYTGVGGGNPKYTGLWGFYNPGQTEWNRE